MHFETYADVSRIGMCPGMSACFVSVQNRLSMCKLTRVKATRGQREKQVGLDLCMSAEKPPSQLGIEERYWRPYSKEVQVELKD